MNPFKKNFSAVLILTQVCTFVVVHAQGVDEIDSLRQVIGSQQDSREKAENLLAAGNLFYKQKQYDSVLAYCDTAMSIASRFDHKVCIADLLYLQSKTYDKIDQQAASLATARKYLQMVEPWDDSVRMGRAYYQYGQVLKDHGEIDSAAIYLKACLAINLGFRDTSNSMVLYNAIGNLFQDYAEYDSAVIYYLHTIQLAEAIGSTRSLPLIYNNLGKTLMKLENYEDARKYLELALELNKERNDTYTDAIILNNIGHTYLHENELDQALVYYDQAAIYYNQHGDRIGIYDLYNNYSFIYEDKQNYAMALSNLDKAIAGYQRLNYQKGLAISYYNKGRVLMKMGQHNRAGIVLDSSLNISQQSGYSELEREAMEHIALNYSKSGNFKKAYDFEKRQFELFKELYYVEKDKAINDLKLKYEREKDQAKILTLQNTNLAMELDLRRKTVQRNSYLLGALGLVILGIFIFLYLRQRVIIARQKIRRLEEEKKLMEARLLVEGQELERKRIARELHDGLGVLLSATRMQFTSIKDVGPESRQIIEKATHLLEQASGDVRKISHNMMPGLLNKLGFYEAVEDLIDNINESEDIRAEFKISGHRIRLPENREIMLYRVIQEMINNSLKHANADSITLYMEVLSDHIIINYSDNGTGFDIDTILQKESGSFGLKNMQSRVNFLEGEIDMESRPGKGVKYVIKIPV